MATMMSPVTINLVNAGTNHQKLLISVSCQYAPPLSDLELISKPGYPVVVYSVSGRPAWEGKTDGVSGVDG
jgi:hypothetical protein